VLGEAAEQVCDVGRLAGGQPDFDLARDGGVSCAGVVGEADAAGPVGGDLDAGSHRVIVRDVDVLEAFGPDEQAAIGDGDRAPGPGRSLGVLSL
jgi:hypothetical protein